MGCALSREWLIGRRFASSRQQSHWESMDVKEQGGYEKPETAIEYPPRTFHSFCKLPFELREHIWFECLSYHTPRAYLLELDVSVGKYDGTNWPPRPVDVKLAPIRDLDYPHGAPDLAAFTAASRTLGATCRESRAAVARLLPDVMEIRADPKPSPNAVQRPHIKSGLFRFNAKRDIIILHDTPFAEMKQAVKWSSNGGVLDAFQTIQNLSIDTNCMDTEVLGKTWAQCHCGELDCTICSEDGLPQFLALFPSLKTLHIAQVTSDYYYDERHSAEIVQTVEPCKCAENGRGGRHEWPIFKGMADDMWLISYEEMSNCAYPTLPKLRDDRLATGSNWPYYDALGRFDVRILRLVSGMAC
ncbi:hypothetical protein J1614_005636 [Plenodomus biglobosus]|nr:hypothetical protein J1614_005636 [Plenodomus biglobosus]